MNYFRSEAGAIAEFVQARADQWRSSTVSDRSLAGVGLAVESQALLKQDGYVAWGISRAFASGVFGERVLIRAYAWLLVATAFFSASMYERRFTMAEDQQYWESLLDEDQQILGEVVAKTLLSGVVAKQAFYRGNPFGASWWGWEDDPVPLKPWKLSYWTGFQQFLTELGYSKCDAEQLAQIRQTKTCRHVDK